MWSFLVSVLPPVSGVFTVVSCPWIVATTVDFPERGTEVRNHLCFILMISPPGVPGLGQEGLELVYGTLQGRQVAMTPPGCSWSLGDTELFPGLSLRAQSGHILPGCKPAFSKWLSSVSDCTQVSQSPTWFPKIPQRHLVQRGMLLGSQGDKWGMFYWALCLMSLIWPSYLLFPLFLLPFI